MTVASPKSFTKKLSSAGRNVFWGLIWLIGLSLLLLFPLRWLFGDAVKIVRIASFVTPWLLVLSLPLLLVAVLARRKWLALVLASASLLIGVTFVALFLPNQQVTAAPDDFSFTVMSFNLHAIDDITGIVEIVRQQEPDILLIQEYSPALVDESFHGFDDLYPELYVDITPLEYAQAIFSRFALEQAQVSYEQGRVEKVIVETPAGPVAVWNVHPIPPFYISSTQFDAQFDALAGAIAQTEGPLIVAGDFNATDQSDAYHAVDRYLANAFYESGWGFGFTFPAHPYTLTSLQLETGPLWRIDHIFHSPDLIATSARTLPAAGGTDHLPIIATISIPSK